MRVICPVKDFYDHYGYIVDPSNFNDPVVYDRLKYFKLSDSTLVAKMCADYVSPKKFFNFRKDDRVSFLVEAGWKKYFFFMDGIKRTDVTPKPNTGINFEYSARFELEEVRDVYEKAFIDPLSIGWYSIRWGYNDRWRYVRTETRRTVKDYKWSELRFSKGKDWEDPGCVIGNPIISGTSLTRLLDPQELWIALDQYLSSLRNDPGVPCDMMDRQKAETKGFEHPKSFRNM